MNIFQKLKWVDQQIINEVLKGRIKLLPSKWNVQSSNFTNRSSYEVASEYYSLRRASKTMEVRELELFQMVLQKV